MGLTSALTTALTGLTAAETTIDVTGNNLANSQTVGFKASQANFATQFLQTRTLGSGPTENTGGNNPQQIGLGVQVGEITPDFGQGTIEISSNASDLAIQGDGFFIVQGGGGEEFYTRNGIFKTNSENELVTLTGNRLLGYGVDDQFNIQETSLQPLTIPLGSAAVAAQTQNVVMEGTLTPTGDVADTAEVVQSAILGDAAVPRPDVSSSLINVSPIPDEASVAVAHSEGGGTHAEGAVYRYRFAFIGDGGNESLSSEELVVTVPAGNALADNAIDLNNIPAAGGEYTQVQIYRTAAGGSDFFKLDTVAAGGTYTDDNSVALSADPLDTTSIAGNYSYLVTFHRNGQVESRPSLVIGPENIVDGRMHLRDLPVPPVPGPTDTFPAYDEIRIYRNLVTDSDTFYLVDTIPPGEDYVDSKTDAEISDLNIVGNQTIDRDGPRISPNTLLTNVVRREDNDFESQFVEGILSLNGRKGGRVMAEKDFEITATSTVQDLLDFMEDALGIQTTQDDPQNPFTASVNNIAGETAALSAGSQLNDGQLRIISNTGVDSAIGLGISALTLTTATGEVSNPNLGFGSIQDAVGESTVADFLVYDSLGIPLNIRVTATLESTNASSTTYRWTADSGDNDPATGADISVGTGLITFDGEGAFLAASNSTVSIARRNIPSTTPLEFELDFSGLSGLAADSASLAAARQDGSGAGKLASFNVAEDGAIRGVFTNGVTRDLGKLQLARFANPAGLEAQGLNLFSAGVNSGLPIQGGPGEDGIGAIVAGAVELSNTDIGRDLLDLVLATTQYRANTRVVNTSQQLLDELLSLRQ